ncbi:uncharacterized protein LOC128895920 [Hylaeus anthracinus]|uniref:uncharacterized protein LOC128895920 n=1 Tax=Hylaeus anthracinus TaxID=313031 RepID=UPI0023B88CB9|nr:uncharacterized protein LOC128895920 [Hylaeus anthracinus]
MEFFRSFLRVIGLLAPAKVDFISELPLEVSQLILRKLDTESLLCAAQVSRKWLDVCSSDKSLRQSVRRHKRRNKKRMRKAFLGRGAAELPNVDVARMLSQKKRTPKQVPRARIDANVLFGRTQHHELRKLIKQGRGSKVAVRSRCMRM